MDHGAKVEACSGNKKDKCCWGTVEVQVWLCLQLGGLKASVHVGTWPFASRSKKGTKLKVGFGGGFFPIFPSPDWIIPSAYRLHPEDKIGRRGF